jgi:hypothetical protein
MDDMDELMIQIAENVPVLKARDTVTFPNKKVFSPQIMVIPFGTLMIPSNINNIFYNGFRLGMQLIVQSISQFFVPECLGCDHHSILKRSATCHSILLKTQTCVLPL